MVNTCYSNKRYTDIKVETFNGRKNPLNNYFLTKNDIARKHILTLFSCSPVKEVALWDDVTLFSTYLFKLAIIVVVWLFIRQPKSLLPLDFHSTLGWPQKHVGVTPKPCSGQENPRYGEVLTDILMNILFGDGYPPSFIMSIMTKLVMRNYYFEKDDKVDIN